MADLDDLLDALGKIATGYDGEDEDDDDRDDDDVDREVGEDRDGDDDDGYSNPRAIALFQKLEAKADENAWMKRKKAAIQSKSKAPTRAEANIKKICELRRKTDAMSYELETNRQLAEQAKLYQDARLALYVSNLTPAERKQRDEETRQMSVWASGFCAEASPTWRDDAQAAFNAKNLPPVGK